jgi:hypothetical protein
MLSKLAVIAAIAATVGVPAASDAQPRADSVTLAERPAKVGDKWTEDQTEISDLVVTMNGQKIPVKSERIEKRSIEVLAVGKAGPTKAKYTFTTDRETTQLPKKSTGGPTAIHGKSYTLTAGEPTGVAGDQGPAPDAEAVLVRKRVKRFGKTDQLGKVLAGKTFLKGKPFELPAAELADVAPDPDIRVVSMVLTYTGMKGGLALFDLAMKAEGERDGSKMKLDFKGKVEVDPKTNTPMDTRMGATVKSTGAQIVEGTMKMTSHRTR